MNNQLLQQLQERAQECANFGNVHDAGLFSAAAEALEAQLKPQSDEREGFRKLTKSESAAWQVGYAAGRASLAVQPQTPSVEEYLKSNAYRQLSDADQHGASIGFRHACAAMRNASRPTDAQQKEEGTA